MLYLHNLWFVTGTDGEHFEHTAAGPEQLLVRVQSHDAHQQSRTPTGQDDQLRERLQQKNLLYKHCFVK